jgi:hypothetical protein
VLTQLQPEATRPTFGTGWGGVLRWCLDFAKRNHTRLEDDPTLPGFDLFVVHLDADVAEKQYRDVSDEIAERASQCRWPDLPSKLACPPASSSVDVVRACVLAWTGIQKPGPKTVLCVPSKAVEAWLAAAVLPDGHDLLNDLECNLRVEAALNSLPKGQRIKKTSRDFRAHERKITEQWSTVRQRCTQAERFSVEVAALDVGS